MRKLQKGDVTVHSVVVIVVKENFFNPQMSSAESECQTLNIIPVNECFSKAYLPKVVSNSSLADWLRAL